jgi:predicted nucleic acid-binding protein
VIVADTGAIVALLDKDDQHHADVRALFADNPDEWVLPWAILPEVDYLIARELGAAAERAWLADVDKGAFAVEWAAAGDLAAARTLVERYSALEMGLVDAVVMATAERLGADIATFDLRHFGAVRLVHNPRLLPRDAPLDPRSRRASTARSGAPRTHQDPPPARGWRR